MNTTPSSPLASAAGPAPGAVPPATIGRAVWIGIGAVVLTAAGVGSALGWRAGQQQTAAPATVATVATAADPVPAGEAMPRSAPVAPSPVIDEPAERPVAKPPVRRAAVEPRPVAQAPVCATCGVVESVQAVRQQGQGTGIGAVAGGVLGGVVGNQIGGGNGRKAMTVLGAIGGGVAGHEIEKSTRSTTVYSVRVRMDDGTVRTVQQSQAPAVGARVQLDGSTLRAG